MRASMLQAPSSFRPTKSVLLVAAVEVEAPTAVELAAVEGVAVEEEVVVVAEVVEEAVAVVAADHSLRSYC